MEFVPVDKPPQSKFAGHGFEPDDLNVYVFAAGPHVITNERNFWRNRLDVAPKDSARYRAAAFFSQNLDLCATMQYGQAMSKDTKKMVGAYIMMAGMVATSRLLRTIINIDPAGKYVVDHDLTDPTAPGMQFQVADLATFGLSATSDGQKHYFANDTLYVATTYPAHISPQMEMALPPHMDPSHFATVTPRLRAREWVDGTDTAKRRVN